MATDHEAGVDGRARCAAHAKPMGDTEKALRDLRPRTPLPLEPGTKVALRVDPLRAVARAVGRELRPVFVILGIITERQQHGVVTRYRIGDGAGASVEVNPALVEPYAEPPAPGAFGPAGPPEPKPARPKPGPAPTLVSFEEVAPGLMESECGRFRLTRSDRWCAFDTWTGETSAPSAERGPALAWVTNRLALPVPQLNWTKTANTTFCEHLGARFEVFQVGGGKWKGFDSRFTSEAFGSPLFERPERAKAWCAVRAGCEAMSAPHGPARPVLVTGESEAPEAF